MQGEMRRLRARLRPQVDPEAQLHGASLLAIRIGWVAMVVLALGLFVRALPLHYAQIHVVSDQARHAMQQLSPPEADALAALGISVHAYALGVVLLEIICVVAFFVPAVVIFWQRSGDRVGLLVSTTGVLYATFITLPLDVLLDAHEPWRSLSSIVQAAGWWCAVVFYYLVPTGRFVPGWTRPLAIASAVYAVIWGLSPGQPWNIANAFGLTYPWFPAHFVWFIAGVVAQIRRYRRERDPALRQQIQWVVYCLVIVVVVHFSSVVFRIFVARPGGLGTPILLYTFSLEPLILLVLLFVPVAVSFSILRYRLLDIDVVINRTMVYAALTALLAAVYFGVVILLQAIVRGIDPTADSPLVIVAATLGSAALFQPLRHRLQRVVDRRFYRRKYDAALTLQAFSAKLRDPVDLERLSTDLVRIVEETMQPAHASLWLKPPRSDHDTS